MIKRIVSLCLRLLFVLLFFAVATIAVMQTLGYEYSFKYGLTKTSIVDISARLGEADVYFDGELVSKELPFEINKVPLGRHSLKIVKTGYEDYVTEIEIKEGLVSKVERVFLIQKEKDLIAFGEDEFHDSFSEGPRFLGMNADDLFSLYSFVDGAFFEIASFVHKGDWKFLSDASLGYMDDEFIHLLLQPYLVPVKYKLPNAAIRKWDYLPEIGFLVLLTESNELRLVNPESKDISSRLIEGVDGSFWRQGSSLITLSSDALTIIDPFSGSIIMRFDGEFPVDDFDGDVLYFDSSLLLWSKNNEGRLELFTLFDKENPKLIAQNVHAITDISPDLEFLALKENGDIELHNLENETAVVLTRFDTADFDLQWDGSTHFWILGSDRASICELNGQCAVFFDNLDQKPLYFEDGRFMFIKKDGEYFLHPIDDGVQASEWWRWR